MGDEFNSKTNTSKKVRRQYIMTTLYIQMGAYFLTIGLTFFGMQLSQNVIFL